MTDEPHDLVGDFVDNTLRLSCADAIQLITDYLDDALNRADLKAFETHLGLCESCTVYLDQIKMTIRLTGASGDVVEVLPANFDDLADELTRRASQ